MPECSYCRKTFPSVGLGGGDHNWLICASARIAELEAALRDVVAAMDAPLGENADGGVDVHDAVERARALSVPPASSDAIANMREREERG